MFKYPRIYAYKELLNIKKKQLDRLYKITKQHCDAWNKNTEDRTQSYVRIFLSLLDRHYPNLKFRNKIRQLKNDYNLLNDEIDKEIFLTTNYGVRCRNLALLVINKYKC